MTGPELARNLSQLTDETRALRRAVTRSARLIRLVAAVAVLGLALTVGVGVLYVQQRDTNRRLTAAVHEQCSLYGLFFDSYAPRRQPAERRAQYEAAFARLHRSAAALGCDRK